MKIAWLRPSDPPDAFPPVDEALTDPNGLLCAGGDLAPERLLAAYRRGIFPWFGPGQPILWWAPDPRMVLFPDEFHVSRSLCKTLRNRGYRVTFDTSFAQVIAQCAASGTRGVEGTWIVPLVHDAYVALHALGHAHSVEVWHDEGLVGGLYGVRLGRIFFGESMFSKATDASKVALYSLLQRWGSRELDLVDCQVPSEHLFTLGARLIPRAEFTERLARGVASISAGNAR